MSRHSEALAALNPKRGDIVRVTAKAETRSDGWGINWNNTSAINMDHAVDKTFEVLEVDNISTRGVLLNTKDTLGATRDFWFPAFVLERVVTEAPKPENLNQQAIELQGIVPGDRVRVLCKAEGHAHGWTLPWVSSMDPAVGQVFMVKDTSSVMGVQLKTDSTCGYTAWFPGYVLEKLCPTREWCPLLTREALRAALDNGRKVQLFCGRPQDHFSDQPGWVSIGRKYEPTSVKCAYRMQIQPESAVEAAASEDVFAGLDRIKLRALWDQRTDNDKAKLDAILRQWDCGEASAISSSKLDDIVIACGQVLPNMHTNAWYSERRRHAAKVVRAFLAEDAAIKIEGTPDALIVGRTIHQTIEDGLGNVGDVFAGLDEAYLRRLWAGAKADPASGIANIDNHLAAWDAGQCADGASYDLNKMVTHCLAKLDSTEEGRQRMAQVVRALRLEDKLQTRGTTATFDELEKSDELVLKLINYSSTDYKFYLDKIKGLGRDSAKALEQGLYRDPEQPSRFHVDESLRPRVQAIFQHASRRGGSKYNTRTLRLAVAGLISHYWEEAFGGTVGTVDGSTSDGDIIDLKTAPFRTIGVTFREASGPECYKKVYAYRVTPAQYDKMAQAWGTGGKITIKVDTPYGDGKVCDVVELHHANNPKATKFIKSYTIRTTRTPAVATTDYANQFQFKDGDLVTQRKLKLGDPVRIIGACQSGGDWIGQTGTIIDTQDYGNLFLVQVDESGFGKAANYYRASALRLLDNPAVPTQLQESTEMNVNIKKRTFVTAPGIGDNMNVDGLTDDQIFDAIAKVEAEIERLGKVKTKSVKLDARIAELSQAAADLAALVDERATKE